jgi:hypothetical protein
MSNTIEMLFGSGLTEGAKVERVSERISERISEQVSEQVSEWGGDWIRAGSSPADGGFDTYYDPATIRNDGNIATMWHLHDFKTAQQVAGKAYRSLRNLVAYDCREPRRRTLRFAWQAQNMGAGETIAHRDAPAGWVPVVPGSMGAVLRALACARR